jgi:hypothetical protein
MVPDVSSLGVAGRRSLLARKQLVSETKTAKSASDICREHGGDRGGVHWIFS